jgi:hypothetical protein
MLAIQWTGETGGMTDQKMRRTMLPNIQPHESGSKSFWRADRTRQSITMVQENAISPSLGQIGALSTTTT